MRRLVDGTLGAGEHRLTWDGRNSSGETAPSGVYFVRVDASPIVRTEKIVSLRAR